MKNKFNGYHLFDGRFIVIATMHEKEKVIAPILEQELDVKCITISNLNTDTFGTFSGEIERVNPPLETVRQKALEALKLCAADLVIASEGSFGPHPASFFVSANEEYIILIDKKHNLEIVGRHVTVNTNFNQEKIFKFDDFAEFKTRIGYPQHGIILKIKDENKGSEKIYKDFDSTKILDGIVIAAIENRHKIIAETDMRAMNNPTRMLAIEQATIDLLKNIKSICPNCEAPGFSINEVIKGLPCMLCRSPTKSPKAFSYKCKVCNFSEVRPKVDELLEDPTYCGFCNP